MSREDFEEKKLELLTNLKLNMVEIDELQRRTVEQANCVKWKKERSKRLTASNFGKICKLRKTTSRKNSVISVLYQSEYFHGTAATRYGIQFESIAKDEFEKLFGYKVAPAGCLLTLICHFWQQHQMGLLRMIQ
ncbi:uncharacterized protein LOC112691308 isoform X2 [Sipha flava]|nr:uncharacterized protein LOC112691308 isoform X2 [Sipha flava]